MSYITKKLEVGANIRIAINERGIKQRFVADKLGMSPQNFNDLLSGRRSIRVVELGRIAEVLNVTVDELLTRKWGDVHEIKRCDEPV